jgi:superfamily II DNA or RNA helicase/HKD family nuclease
MSTKFFNNNTGNTLYEKFQGISENMPNFEIFQAVVGYFRTSGYFKLREAFKNVKKIQILVGINVDDVFKNHNQALLKLADPTKAKELYSKEIINDVKEANYSSEVEEGIIRLIKDLQSGEVEIKIHPSKNLHAKFYLCLPEVFNPNTGGCVIMGSSNISDSGLGLSADERYELNVEMRDYDDVNFCEEEFQRLWDEGIALSWNDMEKSIKQTHIGTLPTPYEIYIKVLIDTFGCQIEDEFSMEMPEGVKELKYQTDAVIQGYQMLLSHNGFFLADVVGLGKTIVATMIAKRFIEANGLHANILVIYPPSIEKNWRDAFKQFGIQKYAQFISNGSLSKIIEGKGNYHDKEDYDLIIIDEAHNFRSDDAQRYDILQRICKSPRSNIGFIGGTQKKVMLLSATPLNNRPDDFLNLILLFQDNKRTSLEGVYNITNTFSPWIDEYRKIMKERYALSPKQYTKKIDNIYSEMRLKVLDQITVRRTRHNIEEDSYYKQDLDNQGIIFPKILPPKDLTYQLDPKLDKLFYETIDVLTDTPVEGAPAAKGVTYARYRAVEFLTGDYKNKYQNAEHIAATLTGIYRVHMVKRLESSFYAFKRSLETFHRITCQMIDMFRAGKIIVAPELKVKDKLDRGEELDQIIEEAISQNGLERSEFVFPPEAFEEQFLEMLKGDEKKLKELMARWAEVDEDPKLDLFIEKLKGELFSNTINPSGKLVVFSESVDTVDYLTDKLKTSLNRGDILNVCSSNRDKLQKTIGENFDANSQKQDNTYNILISSDVLSEGVNLHRANVIVNYDSPWNATRLMQRIGRVNRIGSIANEIHNYMFYPSAQGDNEIRLYSNALIKIQGFHSALGEDAQIFSKEEMLREFQMYDPKVHDNVDKTLSLLREVRDLYNYNKDLYNKIKAMPLKSRTVRNLKDVKKNGIIHNTTIAFLRSPRKIEYYLISNDDKCSPIKFLDATDILYAKIDEKPGALNSVKEAHYRHINIALSKYKETISEISDDFSIKAKYKDPKTIESQSFLRNVMRALSDDEIKKECEILYKLIDAGIYSQLPDVIRRLSRKIKNDPQKIVENQYLIVTNISDLYKRYYTFSDLCEDNTLESNPNIVISETFN